MKRYLLSALITLCFVSSIAQITTAEYPPSFYESQLSKTTPIEAISIKAPGLEEVRKQDKVDDNIKTIPFRFGVAIDVDFDLKKDWTLTSRNQKEYLVQLAVKVKGAKSLNLNFNDFYLSKNARLFIYSKNYNQVLGAITASNNKKNQLFSTIPISGEQVVLELIVPKDEYLENRIYLDQIVYGYRSFANKGLKSFGSSQGCNINVNCPEGDLWQEVKKSVTMIMTDNNRRVCSGALINNVRQDSTPYILTAAHCNIGTNAVYVFNYESEDCDPSRDGIVTNSVSGASIRSVATNKFTDFKLMELSSPIPTSYGVYYAGWSAIDTASPIATAIHHPTGDVKKISVDYDSIFSGEYFSSTDNSHWTIGDWDLGSTAGGSSGSPLFDKNQRIIGQLQGGPAGCGNTGSDYYGKFSVSWETKTPITEQLKHWLDPDSTGVLIVDGLSIGQAEFKNDVQLIYLGGIDSYICDSIISPVVSVKNNGEDTIFTLNFDYSIDNNTNATYTVNDTLSRNQLKEFTLPSIKVESGNHTLTVDASIGNNKTDENLNNNSGNISFQSTKTSELLTITIKTDDYGNETFWELIDATSKLMITSNGPFTQIPGGRVYTKASCVADTGCYYIDLYDSAGDGFNSSITGNGYLLVQKANGDTLVFEDDFRGESINNLFCINDTLTGIKEINDQTKLLLSVYPNPIKKGETITVKDQTGIAINEVVLLDALGRTVKTKKGNQLMIPLSISSGLYFIKSENNISKIIVQ